MSRGTWCWTLSGVTFFSVTGVLLGDRRRSADANVTAQQDRYVPVLVGNSRLVMTVLGVLNLAQRFRDMATLMTWSRPATESLVT
jgi:hypothetical protein